MASDEHFFGRRPGCMAVGVRDHVTGNENPQTGSENPQTGSVKKSHFFNWKKLIFTSGTCAREIRAPIFYNSMSVSALIMSTSSSVEGVYP